MTFSEILANPPPPESDFIRHENGYIDLLIYGNGNGYPIEHSRMNTPEKVLGWIHHLTSKQNVTRRHIRAFIKAAQTLGVNVDFHL